MPDYPTLLRSSSQAPSAHTQRSIRHRSGAYQSSPSPKTSTASQHTVSHRLSDVPRDAQVGLSNGHATATTSSPSNASHFTAIPGRSRRTSVVPGRHRSPSHRATLDVGDDTIALPTDKPSSTRATALSTSYFSQLSTNIQLLAKQFSYLVHSAVISLRQKRNFSNSRFLQVGLPITVDTRIRPPSPKKGLGLESALTPADKLTHKWPRPWSSRSVAPWLRSTNPLSPRNIRGDGSCHMETVLRESRGLGVDWVGQWTLHKWCLLASVTTVFLLGLTCLVYSLLTWFAGKSTVTVCVTVSHVSS
jgi:hypothetical protein